MESPLDDIDVLFHIREFVFKLPPHFIVVKKKRKEKV